MPLITTPTGLELAMRFSASGFWRAHSTARCKGKLRRPSIATSASYVNGPEPSSTTRCNPLVRRILSLWFGSTQNSEAARHDAATHECTVLPLFRVVPSGRKCTFAILREVIQDSWVQYRWAGIACPSSTGHRRLA
jgi:hypothetical protein